MRKDLLHDEWSKKVKKRDNYKCACCGRVSKWNHAHHIDGYDWFPAGRYLVSNGITLCSGDGKKGRRYGCHDKFHNEYGKGKNTRFQFKEFIRRYGNTS